MTRLSSVNLLAMDVVIIEYKGAAGSTSIHESEHQRLISMPKKGHVMHLHSNLAASNNSSSRLVGPQLQHPTVKHPLKLKYVYLYKV